MLISLERFGVLKSFWRPRVIFAKCRLSRESLARVTVTGAKLGADRDVDEYDNMRCRYISPAR